MNKEPVEPKGGLAAVPHGLPALERAHVQGAEAARVGFDWPDYTGVIEKIKEELAELEAAIEGGDPGKIAHEYGDLLMASATLGRHLGVLPTQALQAANDRFAERFAELERLAGGRVEALDAPALDALWEAAKRGLASRAAGRD